MSFDGETDGLETLELDPRCELGELTRALRAHTEQLIASGAWGTAPAPPRPFTESRPSAPARVVPTPPLTNQRVASQVAVSSHTVQRPPPSDMPGAAAAQGPQPAATQSPQPAATQSPQPAATQSPQPAATQSPQPAATQSPQPAATQSPQPAATKGPEPAASAVLSRALPVLLSPEDRSAQLTALASSIVGCTQCRLHEGRHQTVFARGNGTSGLCFIGEGPGADEDAQGLPFVGAAGQLLDRMVAAMGLSRDEIYVCNIVKCRPPDNRKPLPDEMSTCRPYLDQQLEILSPEVIVALGATAVEGLLGVSGGITRLRGTWKLYKGRIAVMPTFHPAYLLRTPSAKHAVWEDMQAVLRHMGRSAPTRGKK